MRSRIIGVVALLVAALALTIGPAQAMVRGPQAALPAVGSWSHDPGYPNPAWDINVRGTVDCGDYVRSTRDATVSGVWFWSNSYGHHVTIADTLYAHMGAVYVHRGEHVRRGEVIGRVSMTGDATGCHLHYETGRR